MLFFILRKGSQGETFAALENETPGIRYLDFHCLSLLHKIMEILLIRKIQKC